MTNLPLLGTQRGSVVRAMVDIALRETPENCRHISQIACKPECMHASRACNRLAERIDGLTTDTARVLRSAYEDVVRFDARAKPLATWYFRFANSPLRDSSVGDQIGDSMF